MSRNKPIQKVKYSPINKNFKFIINQVANATNTYTVDIITHTGTSGVRKVKNFYLNMQNKEANQPLNWSLIYVPQGMPNPANNIGMEPVDNPAVTTYNASDLYQPNQNVIMSGVFTNHNHTVNRTTRLSRNLNSGDKIVLCLTCPSATIPYNVVCWGTVSTAICFN